jgi:hypothetical protein
MNKDDKLEAYKIAIDLHKYEGSLSWQIFGIYLIIHTIIISFLSELIRKYSPFLDFNIFLFFAGLIGLFITVLWIACYQRNSGFHKLRLFQAKEFEPKDFKILNGPAEDFANRGITKYGEDIEMEYFGKKIKTKLAFRLLFGLVSVFYIFIIIAYGPWFLIPRSVCMNVIRLLF